MSVAPQGSFDADLLFRLPTRYRRSANESLRGRPGLKWNPVSSYVMAHESDYTSPATDVEAVNEPQFYCIYCPNIVDVVTAFVSRLCKP
jgi:hypothetical protein